MCVLLWHCVDVDMTIKAVSAPSYNNLDVTFFLSFKYFYAHWVEIFISLCVRKPKIDMPECSLF